MQKNEETKQALETKNVLELTTHTSILCKQVTNEVAIVWSTSGLQRTQLPLN